MTAPSSQSWSGIGDDFEREIRRGNGVTRVRDLAHAFNEIDMIAGRRMPEWRVREIMKQIGARVEADIESVLGLCALPPTAAELAAHPLDRRDYMPGNLSQVAWAKDSARRQHAKGWLTDGELADILRRCETVEAELRRAEIADKTT